MNRTWLLVIVGGLLMASCTLQAPSPAPTVPSEAAPEPAPKIVEVPQPKLFDGSPKELAVAVSEPVEYGKTVFTILSISRDSGVSVDVDGVKGHLAETKDYEIVNGLKITLLKYDYSDVNKPKANIILEEFKLGENEYLVSSDKPLDIAGTRVKLAEVGEDYVYAEVGPGSAEKIFINNEKGFGNIRVKLLKPFSKDTTRQPYAWLLVVSS